MSANLNITEHTRKLFSGKSSKQILSEQQNQADNTSRTHPNTDLQPCKKCFSNSQFLNQKFLQTLEEKLNATSND